MAAAIIQSGHGLFNTAGAASSVVVPMATGVADGEFLLTILHLRTERTITPPVGGGWAHLITHTDTAFGGLQTSIYWKYASGESGPYTWNFSGNSARVASCIRITGVHASSAVNASGGNNSNNIVSMPIVCPSVASGAADGLVLRIGTTRSNNAITAVPGTQTYIETQVSSTGNISASLSWANQASAGATGTANITIAGNNFWSGVTVVIAPVASVDTSTGNAAQQAPFPSQALAAQSLARATVAQTAPFPTQSLVGQSLARATIVQAAPFPTQALVAQSIVSGAAAQQAPFPSQALVGQSLARADIAQSAPFPSQVLTGEIETVVDATGIIAQFAPFPSQRLSSVKLSTGPIHAMCISSRVYCKTLNVNRIYPNVRQPKPYVRLIQ